MSSNSNINGVSSVDKPNELPAFSDIVRQATISDFPRRTTKIRETAVAAVYVDKAKVERRTSSFIISGLPLTNSSSDRDLVSHLCLNEFGICPEIAFTKRLGRPVPDKVQPLLVYVKQTDQAKFIVSAARQLRESHDTYTRDHIYINENLTKAAARAAYELRCRRRQTADRHTARRQNRVAESHKISTSQESSVLSGAVAATDNPSQQLQLSHQPEVSVPIPTTSMSTSTSTHTD